MIVRDFMGNDIPEAAQISRGSFSDPWTESGFSSYISGENSVCLSAAEEKLAGYVMASTDGDTAWIDSIAVHSGYRRRGVGTMLLAALREKTNGIPITLEVRESNLPARRLYEKYGFETAGIRRNMYSDPRENAVVMILKESEHKC